MRVMVRSSKGGNCQQHSDGGGDGAGSSTDGAKTDGIVSRRQATAAASAGAGSSPRGRSASPRPPPPASSYRKTRRGKKGSGGRNAAGRSASPVSGRSCRGGGIGGNATTDNSSSSRPMTPPPTSCISHHSKGVSRSPRTPTPRSSSSKKSSPNHLRVVAPAAAVTPSSHGGRASAGFVAPPRSGRRGGLVRRTHSPKTVASPLSKPVQLSELSRCHVPSISGAVSAPRPRPVFPANMSSQSGGKRRKRKGVDSSSSSSDKSKRQAVFMPVKSSSSSSIRNLKRKSSSRSRSRSPKSPRSRARCSSPSTTPSAKVLTVAPTVRGISEAARILRMSTVEKKNAADATGPTPPNERGGGILSFPTETVYTLTTCVRIKPHSAAQKVTRSSSSSSVSSMSSSTSSSSSSDDSSEQVAAAMPHTSTHTSLNALLELKGKQNDEAAAIASADQQQTVGSNRDPPLLYVHSPSQHRKFFQFTRPKTFMIKKSAAADDGTSSSSPGGSPSKHIHGESPVAKGKQPRQKQQQSTPQKVMVPAVTFSESREVLDRIAAAFWPGPVAIYAPAKLRRVAAADGKSQQDGRDSPKGSSPSKNSDADADTTQYAHVLPASLLVRNRNPTKDGRDDATAAAETNYVGIRCPSHPLARRVLEEVYYKSNNSGGGSKGSPGHRHCTRSSVVVGFDASVPNAKTDSLAPTKAKDVCLQLLSPSPRENSSPSKEGQPKLTAVHVLNGEDKRELFTHVTCEFGAESSVSLVVDDESRTIRILKRLGPDGKDSHPNVCSATVMRALLKTSPQLPFSPAKGEKQDPSAATAGARVVTAVLQRWKAVEEIV